MPETYEKLFKLGREPNIYQIQQLRQQLSSQVLVSLQLQLRLQQPLRLSLQQTAITMLRNGVNRGPKLVIKLSRVTI